MKRSRTYNVLSRGDHDSSRDPRIHSSRFVMLTSHRPVSSLLTGLFILTGAACSTSSAHDGMNMGDSGHGDDPVTSSAPSSEAIPAITFDALFVVNGSDNSISVINTETNELAGTIVLKNATYPHHIYLSADRSKLALAVPGMDLSGGHGGHGMGHVMPGIVMLLDPTTGATLKSRQLSAMNHNAAFAPSSPEVWTTQMADPAKVLILDAETLEDKEAADVGMGPAEVTFASNGKNAFVANGAANTVTVIDAATKSVVKTIPVGDGPVGAWQGSNGVAYVDNEAGKSLTAIDTKTLAVKLTYNLGFTPAYAALAPDDTLWVTDTDNGKVVFYMSDMDMKHGDTATGAGAHAIAFAGTKTGYITNQTANTVSVIDVATHKVIKTIPVGQKPNGMVWRSK